MKEKIKYWFDNRIAASSFSMLAWISLLAIALVFLASFLYVTFLWALGVSSFSFPEALWKTINVTLDPGSMASETHWEDRLPLLFVSFLGLLFVSTIIGIVGSAIQNKILELRRGRSMVLESSHILILGWSNKIDIAVAELMLANESKKKCRLVILAPLDKIEMESFLVRKLGRKVMKVIICRTGEPSDPSQLRLVRPEFARSILLICNDRKKNDLVIFKRSMALQKLFETNHKWIPIVTEVVDPEVAKAVKTLGDNFRIVRSEEFITRILVQAARQSGLSQVYEEILSFEGSEIYTIENPAIVGATFKDVVLGLPNSCAIGIVKANGDTELNPSYTSKIQKGEKIILIAEDDSLIQPYKPINDSFTLTNREHNIEKDRLPIKLLILGWHESGNVLLNELDMQLPNGSSVLVAYNQEYIPSGMNLNEREINNIEIKFLSGLTHTRTFLEGIDLIGIDAIIILGYRTNIEIDEADTLSLMSLVHLRNITDIQGTKMEIATELLDSSNRQIAERERAEDFIASENLITMAMTQLVENPDMENIFNLMLTSAGPEFHTRRVEEYGALNCSMKFGELIESGLQKNELVVGVIERDSHNLSAKICFSPPKTEVLNLGKKDSIVVLAEE